MAPDWPSAHRPPHRSGPPVSGLPGKHQALQFQIPATSRYRKPSAAAESTESAAKRARCGLPADRVQFAPEAMATVPLLLDLIEQNDIVLVKGSLGMAMDRIVTELRQDN